MFEYVEKKRLQSVTLGVSVHALFSVAIICMCSAQAVYTVYRFPIRAVKYSTAFGLLFVMPQVHVPLACVFIATLAHARQ